MNDASAPDLYDPPRALGLDVLALAIAHRLDAHFAGRGPSRRPQRSTLVEPIALPFLATDALSPIEAIPFLGDSAVQTLTDSMFQELP